MIYLKLFCEFFKIGAFTFGGAYGAIPLIQQAVTENGWMTEEMFSNVLAIAESTPGPIMVNSATYIGNSQAGILGATVATLGVILPSFIIILLIATLLQKFVNNSGFQAVLSGVKPCIIGVILATGIFMAISTVIGSIGNITFDLIGLIILIILAGIMITYKIIRKQNFSPIVLILISAVLGMILYAF